MDIIMNFGEDLELDADNDVVGADTGRVVAKFSHHAEAESFVKFYNNQKNQQAEITSLREQLEIAKKDGWISVKDRLPRELMCVTTTDGSHARPAYRTGNSRWSAWGDDKVTHWQPLPEPPKE